MAKHYFSAAELADFEYCPLAWWEEQTNSLADLTEEELEEHLAELRERYDERATILPEYQLVLRLRDRHGVLDGGRVAHEAHAEQVAALAAPAHPSTLVAWRVILLVAVILLLVGILLWLR